MLLVEAVGIDKIIDTTKVSGQYIWIMSEKKIAFSIILPVSFSVKKITIHEGSSHMIVMR